MDARRVITDQADAAEQLRSPDKNKRLAAARFFVRELAARHIPAVRSALASEDVYWVRAALQSALKKVGQLEDSQDTSFRDEASVRVNLEDLPPETVNSAARLLLHELRAPVGRLDAYASQEVPNFETSVTNRELQLIRMKLESIDNLGQASTAPVNAEFDLAELLEKLARSFTTPAAQVRTQGQKPFLIVSDESLISFIVSSGLQNAVEASTRALPAHAPGNVVVSWGATADENYVRILDDGEGVHAPFAELVKWGKTTKAAGHGYGLAIAYAAANSLSGKVFLENAKDKGARFDFRWRAHKA